MMLMKSCTTFTLVFLCFANAVQARPADTNSELSSRVDNKAALWSGSRVPYPLGRPEKSSGSHHFHAISQMTYLLISKVSPTYHEQFNSALIEPLREWHSKMWNRSLDKLSRLIEGIGIAPLNRDTVAVS
jgi:hypothetical protein